ncbi:MAG: response regulator [Anaerolineae bacterium]|nr:response regulator [Anaerolineae bacterium]
MTTAKRKTSILIVDDDDSLRRTMTLILTHKGYAVESALDGAQAVELVRAHPFDMVLMDIRMPVVNGVEALKQIRAIRPEAVVTMMTAYAVEDLIEDALAEGVFALLDKPVEIDQVIALIEQARQARQGALVLVVDDDRGTCTMLEDVLLQAGYRVCTAHSGQEAIDRAHRTAYDILLIELNLPVLNGLETYLAIKKIHPQVVAIVFTTCPKQVAELALDNNAYACLSKPLDIDRLLDLIRESDRKKWER